MGPSKHQMIPLSMIPITTEEFLIRAKCNQTYMRRILPNNLSYMNFCFLSCCQASQKFMQTKNHKFNFEISFEMVYYTHSSTVNWVTFLELKTHTWQASIALFYLPTPYCFEEDKSDQGTLVLLIRKYPLGSTNSTMDYSFKL